MARSRQQASYATPPYGLADGNFTKYIAELEAFGGIRSDVRRNCVVASVGALTRTWPATHFPRRERDRWATKAAAAFQISERELSELAGMSHQSARTALKTLLRTGFVVELAGMRARGNDRGSTPPTYALKCHVKFSDDSLSVSPISISSGGADQPQPAQAWDV